jgi:hypothetical protein
MEMHGCMEMHGQQNIKKDKELKHVHTGKYVGLYF